MAGENILQTVLNWLRKGYPEGIPASDYVALLEVLHRNLTESEVAAVVDQLTREAVRPISVDDIAEAIAERVLQHPSEADVVRVAARLAFAGWPLANGAGLRHDEALPDDALPGDD